MKIVKIGTFDKNGMPKGWSQDPNDGKHGQHCLGIDVLGPGIVDVNGVEIVEWTEARKEAQK